MDRTTLQPRTDTDAVVIANGTALSGALTLGGYVLAGIQLPSAWTTAAMTFFGSSDNSTFTALLDASGGDLVIPSDVLTVSKWLVFDPAFARMISVLPYLKLNSGTTATPVNQAAERTIQVVLERF